MENGNGQEFTNAWTILGKTIEEYPHKFDIYQKANGIEITKKEGKILQDITTNVTNTNKKDQLQGFSKTITEKWRWGKEQIKKNHKTEKNEESLTAEFKTIWNKLGEAIKAQPQTIKIEETINKIKITPGEEKEKQNKITQTGDNIKLEEYTTILKKNTVQIPQKS